MSRWPVAALVLAGACGPAAGTIDDDDTGASDTGDDTATVDPETGDSDTGGDTVDTEPVQHLWVELYWEQAGDDMDLHLLAPNGVLETESDCYFGTCIDFGPPYHLDWGVIGEPSDDPHLDLDDKTGTGPENITIDAPQDGTFTVVVHDHPGAVHDGEHDVTVNVYFGGALEFTGTRSVTGEDSWTTFAIIDWTARTVGAP